MVTQFQQAPSISVLYPYFKMINDLFLLLQAVKFNNLLYLVRTNWEENSMLNTFSICNFPIGCSRESGSHLSN